MKQQTPPTSTEYVEPLGFKGTAGVWGYEEHDQNISRYFGNIVSDLGALPNGMKSIRTIDVLLNHAPTEEMAANAQLISQSKELAKALQDMIDVNSTILAVMALERVDRFDLVERVKNNLLNSQKVLQQAGLKE